MEISNTIVYLIFGVMIVGKACGYSEEKIMKLVKTLIGFEILISIKFVIKTAKVVIEIAVEFFTKN